MPLRSSQYALQTKPKTMRRGNTSLQQPDKNRVPEVLQRSSDGGSLRVFVADQFGCQFAADQQSLFSDLQLLQEAFKLSTK